MGTKSGKEIEKTWMVPKLPSLKELNILDVIKVDQNYVLLDGSGELRCRKVISKSSTKYDLTVKVGNGMIRTEVVKLLTPEEYKQLKTVAKGSLQQTLLDIGTAYIHIYGGKLHGLILVEVEFPSVKEANRFIPPYWFGKEVTTDIRFRGKSLAFSDGIPQ